LLAAADFFFDLRAEVFFEAVLVDAFLAFDLPVAAVDVVVDEPDELDDPDVPVFGLNTCAPAGAASKQTMASHRIMG